MPLDLSSLRKAVEALDATLDRCQDDALLAGLDAVTRNALRAGAIQHFEFTFELCWKFVQRWLRENGAPEDADHPRTRKELFRLAARRGLVADPLPWFAYGDARNLTAHTYNEDQAAAVYETTRQFAIDARSLLQRLEAAND
ncbi:MAG: HI0074 family nucleotidyltransferase substrate-binding subunit [Deferrisomatales bacterium]